MTNFDDWFTHGLKMGWISDPVCIDHDPLPLREWEAEAMAEGEEVCAVIVRVWHDGTEVEPRTLWEVFDEAEPIDD